jgi:ribosome biogenesis SPOUT family RNA methylase Rps3
VLAQANQLLVVRVGWALGAHIDRHRQVEQSSSDFSSLGLRKLNKQGQNGLLKLNKLVNEPLIFEDRG